MNWLLGFALTFLIGLQENPAWLREGFQKAHEAEKQGRLEEAAKTYEAILRREPDLPIVLHNLGLVYYQLKQYSRSADSLREALRRKPDLQGSRLFLGLAEFRLGNFQKSAELLRMVLISDPRNREARLFLIRNEAALGQFSLDHFREVLEMFPNDVELNYAVGQTCIDRIREIVRQAKDLGPLSDAYVWLGLRKSEERNDSEAAEKYRRQLNQIGSVEVPPIVQEYDSLANVVDQCFRVVQEKAPASRFAHSVQGYVYESQNQIEEALREYRAAEDHFFAGRLLAQNVRLNEAEEEFQKALRADPQNHRAMADLAMLFVQKGENEKALPLLNRLLEQYPADAQGWADLGKVQHKMGELEEAVHSLSRALELDPSLNNVHYQLATIYRAKGLTDLARDELEKFESNRRNELQRFEVKRKENR